jgi:hypothetical protein
VPLLPLVPLLPPSPPLDPNPDVPELAPLEPPELDPSPEELPQAAKVSALAPTAITRPSTRGLTELERIRRA